MSTNALKKSFSYRDLYTNRREQKLVRALLHFVIVRFTQGFMYKRVLTEYQSAPNLCTPQPGLRRYIKNGCFYISRPLGRDYFLDRALPIPVSLFIRKLPSMHQNVHGSQFNEIVYAMDTPLFITGYVAPASSPPRPSPADLPSSCF